MSPAPANPTCPECGQPLPSGALRGICAACAWRTLSEPAAEAEPAPDPPAGTPGGFHVEGHEIIAELARGGAGVVYRARQLHPPREVALKMLLPQLLGSDEMIARFRIEAETIAGMDHPAILPIYTVGVHHAVPFFTLKLATGGSLDARAASFHGDWRAIAGLVATLADAVQFAHSRGVIHRDLKPGNVLFDEAGRAFLTDFGLAKFTAQASSITHPHHVLGTPAYLAPEVAEHGAHTATTAADIYALGAVLYQLLAKTPPFTGPSLAALLKEIADTPPRPPRRHVPAVPADLEVICLRCLAKPPGQRFASAGDLAAELRRWLAGEPIHSRAVSTPERLWRWCRRRPALSALSAALGLTLLGGSIALGLGNRSLTRALAAARAAEADAETKLHASLLSEAALRANSRLLGQPQISLDLLARAARLQRTPDVRSGVAAALTRPDLRLVRELPGTFPEFTTAIDFTPELDAYLMPAADGSFSLRRATDGAVVRTYVSPRRAAPRQLQFNRRGDLLSAIFPDRSVAIWRTERESPFLTLPPPPAGSVPFALHPALPVVAYRLGGDEIRLRQLEDGTERICARELPLVSALSFSPAGDRLAVVRSPALEVIEVATGALLWSQADAVLGLPPVWSDDGALLLTGHRQRNNLDVRDAATGIVRRSLPGHSTLPHSLRFLPGGHRVLSLGFDGTLTLWDAGTGRELLQAPTIARGFTLSSDGRHLGMAGPSDRPAIFAWADEAVWREVRGTFRPGTIPVGFALAPRGEWLASASLESMRRENNARHVVHVALWDPARATEVAGFELRAARDDRFTFAFDPVSPGIVYSVGTGGIWRRAFRPDRERGVSFENETVVSPPGGAFLLRVEPDGTWIVRRSMPGPLLLWPAGDPTREVELTRAGEPYPPVYLVGREHVVTRSAPDAHLQVWSRTSGRPLGALPMTQPAWIGFSPDADRIVVLADLTYRSFTLPSLQAGPTWPAREDGSTLKHFAFSPSGRLLAGETGGSTIELRDGRTFERIITLDPPLELELNALAWAPDESRLYAAFRGPRIFFWDLPVLRRELAARELDW